ncbi:MAG: VanW family protein [Gaiellaceae bacterium]
MRAESPLFTPSARRRRRSRSTPLTLAVGLGVLALLAILLGFAFAGSRQQLAEGTRVAGVDLGGLTQREAAALLDRSFDEVAAEPVSFTAGGEEFPLAADQLAVRPDWRAAVAAAARSGDGFGPIRGFRRLHTRFFGAEVLPALAVSSGALEFALDEVAAAVDRRPKSAAVTRRGLRIQVEAEQAGRRIDREASAAVIARALGSLERQNGAVALPVVVSRPLVTSAILAPVARRARVAVSAPVVLRGAGKSWRIPRWRIAELLMLPSDGATKLAIAGPAADAYFRTLSKRVGKPPVDAGFAVSGESVRVVPARDGTELDVPRAARVLLRAAVSATNRVASLAIVTAAPERSTADARAMGIERRMGIYKTYNSGTTDRITNLRLGVTLLDDTLVPPGGTFSLNGTLGERTAERGFKPAPVIIGNEYAEEVGGGTSQVATTVFNAAWEAGLEITERNPHSLYISRYQLGRDATVYWPTLDLKFVNDTEKWVLVKGFVEGDGIAVAIYGGEKRRIESSPGTIVTTGSAPVERIKDPTLAKGKTVVESSGSTPSRTSVTRTIYGPDGKLIRTETWTTSYKGETRVVRVGTKVTPRPEEAKPKAGKKEKAPPDASATTPAPRP